MISFLVASSESGWSECSKTCGGGEKFKMINNVKQTLACNTLPCPGKRFTFVKVYAISRADFFSVNDHSGNMTLTFVECSLHHRSTFNCFSLFPFIVNGGFTPWSNWTECSASCGGGVSSRTRTCTNPIPMFGGVSCADKPVETKECNAQLCPPPKSKLRTRLSLPSCLACTFIFPIQVM